MRRGLVHALAWSLATGAAATLSWWGVHTVLSGTAYDPPRALPLPAGPVEELPPAGGPPPPSARPPETVRPTPAATPRRTPEKSPAATPSTAPAPPPARRTAPVAPPATTPADTGPNVRSYTVDGGRVAFDLGRTSAELVSATPASGWRMRVWKQTTWIRVSFTSGDREVSVFCLWHDSPPRVQIEEGTA